MAGPLRNKNGKLIGPNTVKEELKKKNKEIKDDKRSYVPASEADTPEGDAGMKNTKEKAAALNKEGRKGFKPDTPAPNAMDSYGAQLKALLSNKAKLVGTDSGDGRNKYQVQINKLKKRMKADGFKFNSLLRDVKKQEKEGKFDRGAEGKAKNKLRAKIQSEKVGGSRGR